MLGIHRTPLSLLLLAVGLSLDAMGAETSGAPVEFNRDIRPILSNTCFKCHGPDVAANKSGLRLDVREAALATHTAKTGLVTTAIVPGKVTASELWRRVTANDPQTVMPPPDALHQLTGNDKELLKRWIEQGAKYQPHWAYAPMEKKAAPAAKAGVLAAMHPIDRFVLVPLSAKGVQPSSEAPPGTLIRRLTLDLTGLPPTASEVEAFVDDLRPDAYERLVDRVLASPHYGERMAVPWLDLVRFADSVGFHGDQEQNIFPYRDYVVDAFNRNLPFDRFTVEQIAGDLLPNATTAQRVASGFNRLNMMTREGGAQSKEYLAKYSADRVRAVSTAWLGSTMACSECHDHKFDPFSTRDFYSLAAFFSDVQQWGVYGDYEYTPEPELKGVDNDHPFPPEIELTSPYLVERAARLRKQIAERTAVLARQAMESPAGQAAIERWAAEVRTRLKDGPSSAWSAAPASNAESTEGVTTTILPDGSVLFVDPPPTVVEGKPAVKKPNPNRLTLLPASGPLSTVRVEVLPDDAHGGYTTREQKYRFDLRLTLALRRAGRTQNEPLAIGYAFAEKSTESYFNGKPLASVHTRWRSDRKIVREPQAAVYHLSEPIEIAPGDELVAVLTSGDVGRVRFTTSPLGGTLPPEELPPETRAALLADRPTAAQNVLIAGVYARSAGIGEKGLDSVSTGLLLDLAGCHEGRTQSLVTVSVDPRVTRVLGRGNWQDDTGEIVAPATPHFLPGAKKASPAGPRSSRLDLARWIASRENPLTARTFVNRLWGQFFGTGLSAVVDDLGMQGEYPTHPELLDWLSLEFVDRGWDVKAMVRLLVTSATYKQSSTRRPELADLDPANRLLAAQNARRLDAEFVRDNALFAAGLLNLDLGGPSVHPYQPEGYYAAINFPQRDYLADTDERQYRRGIYMHWQRTFLHPMLANFDAPSREECTAARNLSTTPQQALTLMNDPTFVEAARVLAERVLPVEPAKRLDAAFLRVLAREPSARERASLGKFYDEQLIAFRAQPEDARKLTSVGLRPAAKDVDRAELAAWTAVSRVLLNLNETIVRY